MCSSKSSVQVTSPEISQKPWRPWESEPEKSHNAPIHLSSSPLKCGESLCHKVTFKRESELRRHRLSKHLKKHELCPVCQRKFTRKDNLTRHMKLSHNSPEQKPVCTFCEKRLSRKDAVQRHESTCAKNPKKIPVPKHSQFQSHMERLRYKFQKSDSRQLVQREIPNRRENLV